MCIESQLRFLKEKNTGSCKCGCGKTFGKLIDHFVVGGNKTGIMAGENGKTVKIIEAKGRNKHEKKTQDSCDSITVYQLGGAAGHIAAMVILVSCEKVHRGYQDSFLKNHGVAIESTILLTPNAFMNTKTWEAMSPNIFKSFKDLNSHVKANPDWWMLEDFDGF